MGGGFYCESSAPTLIECVFVNNSGGEVGPGGGLGCSSASPTLTGCTFIGNSAGGGGGIYCYASAATITDCAFVDNTAHGAGGAFNGQSSWVSFTDCSFAHNSAMTGGAVACLCEPSATLTGCTLRENVAGEGGGGAIYCTAASPELTRCTLYGNAGNSGGGMICYGGCYPVLENTIIAFSTVGAAIHCAPGAEPSLTCCDLYGNAGGDWVGSIAGQGTLAGNICEDPLFCGGTDPEHALNLRDESPCAPFSPPNPACDLIGAGEVGCGSAFAPEPAQILGDRNLGRAVPNPFSGATQLVFHVPAAGGRVPVLITICDVSGRPVRVLEDGHRTPGVYRASWNGKDQAGSPAPAGIYYCELRVGDQTETRGVVRVR